MRRFLDGFYPLRVSYRVDFAGTGLVLHGAHPAARPGFSPRLEGAVYAFDSWFEGELQLELLFRRVETGN